MMPLNDIQTLVHSLHHSQDAQTRREADNKLKDFQETPMAWQVANEMLSNSNSAPLECQLFAAQTLRRKVFAHISDLDEMSRASLLEALLRFLKDKSVHRLIRSQLSLALAYLTVHGNCFPQVYSALSADGSSLLLFFLQSLAEALVTLGDTRSSSPPFSVVKDFSSLQMDLVLRTLFEAAQKSTAGDDLNSILHALISFIKSNLITPDLMSQYPFVPFAFHSLSFEDCFESAADFITEIAYCTKSAGDDQIPLAANLHQQMQSQSIRFSQIITASAQGDDEFSDLLKTVCRLYIDLGEMFCPLIIQRPAQLNYLIDGILLASSVSDLDLVTMTFNFWADFTDELLRSDPETRVKYSGAFDKLIDIMISHLRYPADLQTWTAALRDEFRDFRHVMGDVLKDCCRIMGQSNTLSKVYVKLNGFIASVNSSSSPPSWQDVEACLFALRALGSEVGEAESEYLPKIMDFLFTLTANAHPKLQYAAILVVGRYSDWTKMHPQFIPKELQLISSGFSDPEVMPASALALNFLCQSCGELMLPYVQELLPFYISSVDRLPRQDLVELTQAMAHLIRSSPPSDIPQLLKAFADPFVTRIQSVTSVQLPVEGVRHLEDSLYILTMYYKFVNIPTDNSTPNALLDLFSDLWPILTTIATSPSYSNHRVFEAIARFIKVAFISLEAELQGLLEQILTFLINSYKQFHFASILWVSSLIIRRSLGNQAFSATQDMISRFYMVMIENALESFSNLSRIDEDPEAFEDFTIFLSAGFSSAPQLTLNSDVILKKSLSLLIAGIARPNSLIHESSIKSLKSFFESMKQQNNSINLQVVMSCLTESGVHLVSTLLNGCLGCNEYEFTFHGEMNPLVCYILTAFGSSVPDAVQVVSNYLMSVRNQCGQERLPDETCLSFLNILKDCIDKMDGQQLKFSLASLKSAFRGRTRYNNNNSSGKRK